MNAAPAKLFSFFQISAPQERLYSTWIGYVLHKSTAAEILLAFTWTLLLIQISIITYVYREKRIWTPAMSGIVQIIITVMLVSGKP